MSMTHLSKLRGGCCCLPCTLRLRWVPGTGRGVCATRAGTGERGLLVALTAAAALVLFFIFIFTLFYFTILYWFCHTLTWIHHGCTWVPKHEPPSPLPPHIISLDFWMLSFKPTFSLFSFSFIKRLFSSSSLSAVKVHICISEVIDICGGKLDFSLCFIQPSISHDVLCI